MKRHLLILDDEISVAKVISYMLQDAGWRVTFTHNLEGVLTVLRDDRVDVFLTDYHMPRYNGLQVIEVLRKNHPLMPMILMSGFVLEINAERACRLGVATILEKPIDSDLLIHTLNQF